MHLPLKRLGSVLVSLLILAPALAASGGSPLPASLMQSARIEDAPADNSAFFPSRDSSAGAAFSGVISLAQSPMRTSPVLEKAVIDGRDARLFPGLTLGFFTMGNLLIPVERGEIRWETSPGHTPSYWQLIVQFGRVWKDKADGEWSRAAFPIMLVNDTENHAHQGLATFLYRGNEVTALRFQFVQQTTPYLIPQHFVAWGRAAARLEKSHLDSEQRRSDASRELAGRLPARPWSELVQSAPTHSLDNFGAPLSPKWIVMTAIVREGSVYYSDSATPYGPYPYPQEMRFGPRSIMKSIGVPLALLRLVQLYGPYVLNLKIGDYVNVAEPKYKRVRFIDAADMATGMGGDGSLQTSPNDVGDGYVDPHYDAWYLAHSQAEKMREIDAHNRPYPWEPGTVMRYRDHDFYLLGAALDGFLKSVKGPQADIWDMLRTEVLAPIGIEHAPLVRTREGDGKPGLPWFCAGYYPTLDDLAKIAMLYQDGGAHGGRQLLDRALTTGLFSPANAIRQSSDMSLQTSLPPDNDTQELLYKMGFHFYPFLKQAGGPRIYLPTMRGSTGNLITLYPNRLISIRIAKAWPLPPAEQHSEESPLLMMKAVEQLQPF